MMRTSHMKTGDVFEYGCDKIDVTSNNRPDECWRHTDTHGHVHQWYVEGGGPDGTHISATIYNPSLRYITPTLVFIVDDVGYWEDGTTYGIGHYECADCHDPVPNPGTCADADIVYMPGLRWFRINGQSVAPEEFQRRYTDAIEDSDR